MPGNEYGGPCGPWWFCAPGPASDEAGRWADWWGDECGGCAVKPGNVGRFWLWAVAAFDE
jgi:hypothetical protein